MNKNNTALNFIAALNGQTLLIATCKCCYRRFSYRWIVENAYWQNYIDDCEGLLPEGYLKCRQVVPTQIQRAVLPVQQWDCTSHARGGHRCAEFN